MNRNDILWKGALEDLFDDFLKFFYPNADELFDLGKGFEYLDKELDQLFPPANDNYAPRYVDKLVKVFTKAGQEEWILIHIEVQGQSDRDFAKRMFKYYNRIFDQYDRPITAFAIFTDANKNFHPNHYRRDLLGTKVYYEYNTFKIVEQDDTVLAASNNPFAMVVLSAKLMLSKQKTNDEQLFARAYDLVKLLLSKHISKGKIRNVMNFLKYYIRFENPEMIGKFESEIALLTERSITMGIEELIIDRARKEGILEGREEGIEEGVKKNQRENALKMKQSGFDIKIIADITGLSLAEIKKL